MYLHPIEEGFYLSDEPGFYREGAFGIRIEADLVVQPAETRYAWGSRPFLGFRYCTPVPFCPALIDVSLLTPAQRAWVDAHHARCREKARQPARQKSSRPLRGTWRALHGGPLQPRGAALGRSLLVFLWRRVSSSAPVCPHRSPPGCCATPRAVAARRATPRSRRTSRARSHGSRPPRSPSPLFDLMFLCGARVVKPVCVCDLGPRAGRA